MPEQTRNQSGHGFRIQIGRLVEALESVVFRKAAAPETAPIAESPPAAHEEGQRLLRGLGEALERIAAREADEAAARSQAAR